MYEQLKLREDLNIAKLVADSVKVHEEVNNKSSDLDFNVYITIDGESMGKLDTLDIDSSDTFESIKLLVATTFEKGRQRGISDIKVMLSDFEGLSRLKTSSVECIKCPKNWESLKLALEDGVVDGPTYEDIKIKNLERAGDGSLDVLYIICCECSGNNPHWLK